MFLKTKWLSISQFDYFFSVQNNQPTNQKQPTLPESVHCKIYFKQFKEQQELHKRLWAG